MKYRKFGKLDWKVSALGFGAMRLPIKSKDPADIDEPDAIRMIRYSIDNGVNYVDTAYTYHGGKSEIVVGKALKDGYRDKVKLATKLPSWLVQGQEDFDRLLNEQLEKLKTDRIEFYLLHGLNKDQWPKLRDLDVIKWAESAQADGRIHHLGFSFHDDFEVFKEIVDAYDRWTFCQIQYNYMDTEYQAGRKGLMVAADKGLSVVIMEPIRGGQLGKEPPESIAKLWESASEKRMPADWALQWVWNHPEVSVVLSGMTTMEHVKENLISGDKSGPGTLSNAELELTERVRDEYIKLSPVPCTNCGYCMPCPNGVNIPRSLELYNDAIIYDQPKKERFLYRMMSAEEQGDNCIGCEECLELCPQDIAIPEWLEKAHGWLGPKK